METTVAEEASQQISMNCFSICLLSVMLHQNFQLKQGSRHCYQMCRLYAASLTVDA